MFYGFPTQEGAPHGVKVAMHFNDSDSDLKKDMNRCTPLSLDRTLRQEEEEEVC